jgi:hypothetical protein
VVEVQSILLYRPLPLGFHRRSQCCRLPELVRMGERPFNQPDDPQAIEGSAKIISDRRKRSDGMRKPGNRNRPWRIRTFSYMTVGHRLLFQLNRE